MAASAPPTPFLPTRTVPVFRVQKTPWREWLMSGSAMQVTITTPPAQLATATTLVAGQLYVDGSVPQFPPTVTVDLIQRGAVKATQTAQVVPATGAFATTFPANSMTSGNTATARVSCTLPVATAVSSSFNVT